MVILDLDVCPNIDLEVRRLVWCYSENVGKIEV